MTASEVVSEDGIRLAVQQHGDPAGTTVVLVHGYPDDHRVWDLVVPLLEDLHVVTYDVRGAGGSDKPDGPAPYHLDRLEADLEAVLAVVSPDEPAHLVAHDWGSLQSWHAVTGDRLKGRLATYTSFCGTDLDYAGVWFRRRWRSWTGLRQVLHSQYITVFLIPRIPELAFRTWPVARMFRRLGEGVQVPGWPQQSDLRHGLWLYRANVPERMRRPRPRPTVIPVLVVTATRDPYLTELLQTDVGAWVPDLRLERIDSTHWVPRTEPHQVAALIRSQVGGPSRG